MTINSADDVVCVDYEALLPGSGVDLTPAIEVGSALAGVGVPHLR